MTNGRVPASRAVIHAGSKGDADPRSANSGSIPVSYARTAFPGDAGPVPQTAKPGRAGAIAAALALAAAELLGALLPQRPSLVLGIADRVIRLTPPRIREALIGIVGTQDKFFLAVGICLAVLLIGSAIGRWTTHRANLRLPLIGLLGLVAFVAALGAAPAWGLALIAATAVLVGVLALQRLLPVERETFDDAPTLPRRTFMSATALGALAAAAGVGALAIRRSAVGAVERTRAALHLPKSMNVVTIDATADPHLPGLPPAITSNSSFYRIDTAIEPPAVDISTWRLHIEGLVDHPLTFTYDQINAMPQVSAVVTLACVSNPVGGDLVSNAIWQGVPLRKILEQAGVQAHSDQLVAESVDGFTAGFPVALALDGREALLAVGMNGEALPVPHGFPARLVVPGLYGYVSATKWLSRIRLTTFAAESPFWVQQGWSADGRVSAASRIDLPHSGAKVSAGTVVVAGRAWRQHTGVKGVQISIDNGPWHDAAVAGDMGVDAWRLWTYNWTAMPGSHQLAVRMVDDVGAMQTGQQLPVFPGASQGWHTISVTVT
jgi:DMSO/TMAO reductase YedYZ molybdopterin-dependent catalytic subunit